MWYTVLLLLISNTFMTFAWYGHLKHKSTNLLIVILVSWGIAFFEYCFQVPANRLGSRYCTTAQLKIIDDVTVEHMTDTGDYLRYMIAGSV